MSHPPDTPLRQGREHGQAAAANGCHCRRVRVPSPPGAVGDATRNFTTATFYEWLSEFAGGVEASGRQHVLVDALSFRMASDQMDPEWRDTHIIPRYNAAGVEKFAFLMPEGMPAIGTPPAPEGPAEFPTAYFGTRAEALAWLAV